MVTPAQLHNIKFLSKNLQKQMNLGCPHTPEMELLPSTSAGASLKAMDRTTAFKNKAIQRRLADKSVVNLFVGDKTYMKKITLYEVQGEKNIEIVEVLEDGTVPPTKRANMRFDAVYALKASMPEILARLEKKEVCPDILLDPSTNLHIITSKFVPNTKAYAKAVAKFYVSLRYKFQLDDGTWAVVSKKSLVYI